MTLVIAVLTLPTPLLDALALAVLAGVVVWAVRRRGVRRA